jgi:hypothetical protein
MDHLSVSRLRALSIEAVLTNPRYKAIRQPGGCPCAATTGHSVWNAITTYVNFPDVLRFCLGPLVHSSSESNLGLGV